STRFRSMGASPARRSARRRRARPHYRRPSHCPMNIRLLLGFSLAASTCSLLAAERPFGLVIHGGAGVILRDKLSAESEKEYRAKLQEAIDAGYAVLAGGGSALDAVVAAIKPLEDSPLFNAGKGAVLNADGICELDSSIMDGRTLAAGAVAGVHRIKNPITLSRAVMDKSVHVMFTGDGAERFAEQIGGIE